MKCTLNDLCDIITDGTHQTPEYCGDEGVLFLSSKDVATKKIDWAHAKYIPRSLHDILSSRLTPQRNDILLAKNGTTGVAALVDCEKTFDIYVSLALLRPKKSINPRFLLHAINSPTSKRQFNAGLKGIGVPNLHLNVIKNTIINVPGESKQSHIADCLDTIERLNNSRKQQLEKLDTLVKSRFIEMFGDPVTNPMGWEGAGLGEVCDVRDGTHDSPAYCSEGFPLVTSKNVSSGKIDLSDCNYIAKDDYEKINQRSQVDKGDIIMPMIGTVGIPVIVNFEPNFAIKNVALIKFNSSSVVHNVYIKVLLESNYFDNAIMKKVRGGTQKFISLGDIRKLQVLVPPIDLQNQFADFVQQVDKSKSVLQKLLEKQELLRAALMQEYFG